MSTATLTFTQEALPFAPADPVRYEAVLTCNDVTIERIPLDTLNDAEDAIVALRSEAQRSGVQIARWSDLDFVGLRHGEVWRASVVSIPLQDG